MEEKPFTYQLSRSHIIWNCCFTITEVVKDFEKRGINKKLSKYDSIFKTEFNSETPTLDEYLYKIVKIIKAEKSTIVLAFIFVDKLCNSNNKLLKRENLHKYFFNS